MSYTVQSSERVRKSGADAETKAMLYLMNFRDDSNEMNYFVVDFFNDVTGMDRMANQRHQKREVQKRLAENW